MDGLFGTRALRRFPLLETEWMPAVEMYEKADKYVVKAELPGMKQEDVDISLIGDTLTIKGDKKSESEVKEKDYHFSERSYGSFFRSVRLPSNVDVKKIEASFEDGVLEVFLPKSAEVKPKKIAITAKNSEVKRVASNTSVPRFTNCPWQRTIE
jgi:HSP20 family protein